LEFTLNSGVKLEIGNRKSEINRASFTLLELVAVISIALLITGLVAGTAGRIPAFLSLGSTVQKVQFLFSRASMMAMAQGKSVTVNYQSGGKVFSISPGEQPAEGGFSGKYLSEKIPEAVTVEFDSENPSYIFFPDGSASGTPFNLTLKGHTYRVRISGLTGVTIVEELKEAQK